MLSPPSLKYISTWISGSSRAVDVTHSPGEGPARTENLGGPPDFTAGSRPLCAKSLPYSLVVCESYTLHGFQPLLIFSLT